MLRPMLVPNIFFGSSMARASGGCFDADHLIYSAAVHFTPIYSCRITAGTREIQKVDLHCTVWQVPVSSLPSRVTAR